MTCLLLSTTAAYLSAGLAVGFLCYRILRRDARGDRLDRYDRWAVAFCGTCWPVVLFALWVDWTDFPGFNR